MSNVTTTFPPHVPAYVEPPRLCAWSSTLYYVHISPLSTLISSLSLNHHLYADDTQLFLSFRPPDFDSSATHLKNALQHISSWMTANLLTLNSSKTEFLLIGLQKQLTKIHNCSLLLSLLLSCAKSHMLSASRRQPHLLHVSAVDRRQTWSMDKS